MSRSLRIYRLLEAVLGRRRLYRIGRFLYMGARRELLNDPNVNGEYALQRWVLAALDQQRHTVKRDDKEITWNFIDVGANLGDWTSSMIEAIQSHETSCRTVIHAFEPAPDQSNAIEARFRPRVIDKSVVLLRQAVGAIEGTVSFVITGPQAGNSSIRTGKELIAGSEILVPLTTVDAYSVSGSIEEISVLKVDTEGNDFNVIKGVANMLDAGRIGVLQFEYNWRWIAFGHWLKSAFDFTKQRRKYAFGLLTSDGIEVYEDWNPEMERYIETNYVIVRRSLLSQLPHTLMQYNTSNVPVLESTAAASVKYRENGDEQTYEIP